MRLEHTVWPQDRLRLCQRALRLGRRPGVLVQRQLATFIGDVGRGDAPALVADPSLINSELGWEPRYTKLSEIVATAWKWHRRHPHGYDGTGAVRSTEVSAP